MNKLTKYTVLFLMITSMTTSTLAQEAQSKKKGELEIGFGPHFLGPAYQMAKLMVKYNFDVNQPSFWKGEKDIKYPHNNQFGAINLSYSHYIGPRSQLGILLNYTPRQTVYGYSPIGGHLEVRFSSISLVPLYSFELKKYLEFEAGPTLMINSGNKSRGGLYNEKYTKLSTGLFTELNLKIWNSKVTFGEIGTYYQLDIGNNMGPYTGDNATSIPESKFRFSYLNIFFVFGLKL